MLTTLKEIYFGKNHTLPIDNLYTSLRLTNNLVKNDIKVTAVSAKTENSFNLAWRNTILQKGEAAFHQKESMVIVKYRANKDSARGHPKAVYVISVSHGTAMNNTKIMDRDDNAN